MSPFLAGAASVNITPEKPYFLHGYPNVERISEGVNDRLLSSALFLTDGKEQIIFITNDLLYIDKKSTARIRAGISQKTGVPVSCILIAATHTHSGPITVEGAISGNDPVVPTVDPELVQLLEYRIMDAAQCAFQNAEPAQIGYTIVDGTGVGTNRRNPMWASDSEVPLMVVKNTDGAYIACMMVCSMHPTVMHEDSKLYSGDFPAYTRDLLQKKYLGSMCPVLYFTGAAGNQSPRHVTKSNTFEEAKRIGGILAEAAGNALKKGLNFHSHVDVSCSSHSVDLPRRSFLSVEETDKNRKRALTLLESLRAKKTDSKEIRTAEVDWFGAEEQYYLSKLAEENKLEIYYQSSLPAEIQIMKVGELIFVAWPGEIFVEYALRLKEQSENTFLITLANGELQGYIVTEEAAKNNYYEASNSLFHYSGGETLLSETFKLLDSMK